MERRTEWKGDGVVSSGRECCGGMVCELLRVCVSSSIMDGEVDVSGVVGARGDGWFVFSFFFFGFLIGSWGSSKLWWSCSVRDFLCFFFFSVARSSCSSTCFRFFVLCES